MVCTAELHPCWREPSLHACGIIHLECPSGNLLPDLVPREVAEAWLKYLREEAPTVAFKCSTQRQADNLGQRRLPKSKSSAAGAGREPDLGAGAECLGADELLALLKNYARAADRKVAITVGARPSAIPSPSLQLPLPCL